VNASIVHPREVFKPAINASATSVILGHNHPTGNPEPSREDILITRRMEKTGRILGIDVVDHITVAADRYVSLKERGNI
jgi:DNA repair protein RadC